MTFSYHFVSLQSLMLNLGLSLSEKLEWLKLHFPFISWRNIIFCGDKSIINTDFMIDDHIKNLDYFKGHPIMFHAFHNTSYTHHTRVQDWHEVLSLFKSLG